MATIYLVRHGRAAAGWDADPDPGLHDEGHEQARAMAAKLAPKGPLALLSSPMQRARETAAPLAVAWDLAPLIEPRVTEIPSPTPDLAERGRWLREIATRRWSELDGPVLRWRDQLLAALAEIERDSVVVSHFMVINAAAGVAIGDDRVVHFRPDYCSVTVLRNDGGRLQLVELGSEAQTRVL